MNTAVQSNSPQTLAWETLDSEHILACKREPYLKVEDVIVRAGKSKWYTGRMIPDVWNGDRWIPGRWIPGFRDRPFECCKNKQNVDVEAWWSTQATRDSGEGPDIYKFFCRVCEEKFEKGEIRPGRERVAGYCGVFFCVGGNHPLSAEYTFEERPELYDIRPMWDIR